MNLWLSIANDKSRKPCILFLQEVQIIPRDVLINIWKKKSPIFLSTALIDLIFLKWTKA